MEERAQMDSAALFAMIFGSEKFIPLGAPLILGHAKISYDSFDEFSCECM